MCTFRVSREGVILAESLLKWSHLHSCSCTTSSAYTISIPQHEVTLNQDASLSLCHGRNCRNNPITCFEKQNLGYIQGPSADIFSHLPAMLPALAAPEPHDHTMSLPCRKPSLCLEEKWQHFGERGPSVHVSFSKEGGSFPRYPTGDQNWPEFGHVPISQSSLHRTVPATVVVASPEVEVGRTSPESRGQRWTTE